jgi:hypothetical protein
MAKKKRAKKATSSARRKGAARRATAKNPGARRKTARARAAKGKARGKQAKKPSRAVKRAASRTRTSARKAVPKRGGNGREETLAQTPAAGRSWSGPTNPMPTRRSTGTPSGAGNSRRAPTLERARRQLREVDETVPGPPSSLDVNRLHASAARTGRQELREARRAHNETSPVMTGGDVDADWEDAYSVGDEAPGGDNPTPDQDRVDDIGKALGVEYQDNEELKGGDKVAERDKHRWELDPASSEDYRDRD